MQMKAVKSGNIKKIGYAPESKKLRVQFSSGSEYDYDDVSQKEFDSFVGAKSIGKHFFAKIRNMKKFTKLEKDKG